MIKYELRGHWGWRSFCGRVISPFLGICMRAWLLRKYLPWFLLLRSNSALFPLTINNGGTVQGAEDELSKLTIINIYFAANHQHAASSHRSKYVVRASRNTCFTVRIV